MAGLGYRHMLIILVSALVFTPAAWAMKAENFTFTHLGSKDGLCNQRIFSIVQTADGAIWWSSKSCIERYNGTNISHYTIGQQTKYSDFAGRNIRLVQSHDAQADLYAFDNNGHIFGYSPERNRFEERADIAGTLGREVVLNDILVADDEIWTAMREGIFRLKGNEITAVQPDVYANAIVKAEGRLLFLTKNGLYVRDEAGTDETMNHLAEYDIISGYYDDTNHRLWLGTFSSGVLTVNTETRQVVLCDGLPHIPVRDFCPYDASTMLVGVDGAGVYRIERRQNGRAQLLFDASENSYGVLHGNGVYSLLKDHWGNIVIGSYSGGVDIARPLEGGSVTAFYFHVPNNDQSIINDHVNCLRQDGALLLLGTDDGISIYDQRTSRFRHTARGMVVLDICKTRDERLLAATYGYGVLEIARDGKVVPKYTVQNGALKDNHVYCLYEDRDKGLWMGCLEKKLVRCCGDELQYYDVETVKAIEQLPDGRMAVGTAAGVMIVDPSEGGGVTELHYKPKGEENDVCWYVLDLCVTDQRLWIATDGGGIYIYDTRSGACEQITTEQGLPSNIVNSLAGDGLGRIWAGTDRGLAFLSARNPGTAMNVNYCYGLSREYVQGAVADLSDGRLIFGTTEGAVEIDPRHIRNVDYQAELHLLGLRCTNNDSEQFSRQVGQMLRKGSVELDYDSRTFEIGFEAINLRNQFDIAYQYKIGDGEWSKPTEEQSIRFVNMESGSHVLYLRSVSRTSLHVLDEIELGIVIGRPWWNSWWMRCLYALLLGGAFFGAWKIYELHTKYMRLVVSSPDVNQNRLRVADELPDGKKESERDQFIDKTTRLIVEHLADSDFTIDRLCREMAMSRTLFYVKLKSYTGKSPQDFIRIIRLERSAALLRNGQPVAEVAAMVGIDNAKYFSTVFKKYFGVSPSKYR